MMAAIDEEAVLRRTVTLAEARRICTAWAYWGLRTNIRTGYEPFMNTGGIDRYYANKARWQYETPQPRLPEADENVGLAVQRAFIELPERPYRLILRTEFCVRPWIVPLKDGEVEAMIARRARVSVGAYGITLDRALLALANVMKRKGLWRE
jgi:hypothetical protein